MLSLICSKTWGYCTFDSPNDTIEILIKKSFGLRLERNDAIVKPKIRMGGKEEFSDRPFRLRISQLLIKIVNGSKFAVYGRKTDLTLFVGVKGNIFALRA